METHNLTEQEINSSKQTSDSVISGEMVLIEIVPGGHLRFILF